MKSHAHTIYIHIYIMYLPMYIIQYYRTQSGRPRRAIADLCVFTHAETAYT